MSPGLFLNDHLMSSAQRDLSILKGRDQYGKPIPLNNQLTASKESLLIASQVKRNTYETVWSTKDKKPSKRVSISPRNAQMKEIIE